MNLKNKESKFTGNQKAVIIGISLFALIIISPQIYAAVEPHITITMDPGQTTKPFQIKDDLFDYGKEKIGKPTGIDIKEQKMTLPLIYTLNNCSEKERSWIINSIKNHNKDRKRVKEVIAFVKSKGGLDYAVSKMKDFQQQALLLLLSYPTTLYKESLELMVNYVIDRKK